MSTQRKTITVKQWELGMSWSPIVRAAGLLSDQQDPATVYLLAGAIMRDQVVSERVCQSEDKTYEHVLLEMTDEERAALRERLIAKFSGKGNSQR
jgi:hypothetical protein